MEFNNAEAQPVTSKKKIVAGEDDLLWDLAGRRITTSIETLYFVGAHRFQEKEVLDRIFPSLKSIYLFEPLPELQGTLRELAATDARLTVFPFALSDTDGTAQFHVTNNDAASSSLLRLGTHTRIFPHVTVTTTIEVETRTLNSVLEEYKIAVPEMIMLDVQGAEYQVLSTVSPRLLESVRIIYTEASKEHVYEGSRTLEEIQDLLSPVFSCVGFAPLTNETPMHGNALFVKTNDIKSSMQLTNMARLKRAKKWMRSFHRR